MATLVILLGMRTRELDLQSKKFCVCPSMGLILYRVIFDWLHKAVRKSPADTEGILPSLVVWALVNWTCQGFQLEPLAGKAYLQSVKYELLLWPLAHCTMQNPYCLTGGFLYKSEIKKRTQFCGAQIIVQRNLCDLWLWHQKKVITLIVLLCFWYKVYFSVNTKYKLRKYKLSKIICQYYK